VGGVLNRRATLVLAAMAGALFGVGLLVSGMTQPAKVIGFLDVTHRWDPSLAFVMGGAVIVNFLATRWMLGRGRPFGGVRFHLPAQTRIDTQLLAGAAIFGVGWGLGGFCPGPAIVVAGSGARAGLVFFAAMAAGMLLSSLLRPRPAR
jgi:uncharacterized membrane protein YedE/YeeE